MYTMNVEGERACGTHLDGGRDIHIAQDMLQDIDGNFDILARWDLDLLHFTFGDTYITKTKFSGKLGSKSRGGNKWHRLFFLYLVLFILVLVFTLKKFLFPLPKLIYLLILGVEFLFWQSFGFIWTKDSVGHLRGNYSAEAAGPYRNANAGIFAANTEGAAGGCL